jgi:hypothetical protein
MAGPRPFRRTRRADHEAVRPAQHGLGQRALNGMKRSTPPLVTRTGLEGVDGVAFQGGVCPDSTPQEVNNSRARFGVEFVVGLVFEGT